MLHVRDMWMRDGQSSRGKVHIFRHKLLQEFTVANLLLHAWRMFGNSLTRQRINQHQINSKQNENTFGAFNGSIYFISGKYLLNLLS